MKEKKELLSTIKCYLSKLKKKVLRLSKLAY